MSFGALHCLSVGARSGTPWRPFVHDGLVAVVRRVVGDYDLVIEALEGGNMGEVAPKLGRAVGVGMQMLSFAIPGN